VRQDAEGRWRLGYDPGIAVAFRAQAAPVDLWPLWDAVRCPTLVLRGAHSDVLSGGTAEAMAARGSSRLRTWATRRCSWIPIRGMTLPFGELRAHKGGHPIVH